MLTELFWMLAGGGYIAARGIKEASIPMKVQAYDKAHGFNKGRQLKLERMATSADRAECMEFARLCGYIPNGEHERRRAVREISIREGWRYFDIREVSCDPVYVKINGGKYPEWNNPVLLARSWKAVEDEAKEHIAEVDRRKAWIERCEHGDEVDVFPMSFETEALYRAAVAYTYRNRCQSNTGT